MKHRRLLPGIICCLLLGLLGSAQAVDEKIRFIDLNKAFDEYYKTKLADAQLKDQVEASKSESKKLVEVYEELQEKFKEIREKANNPALTDQARDEFRQQAEELLIEIRDQQSKIRRFEETSRKRVEDQGRRMRKRLVDEIKENVKTFAKAKGFNAVIDVSGQSLNGVELVLYFDVKVDITNEIIDLLNKGQR